MKRTLIIVVVAAAIILAACGAAYRTPTSVETVYVSDQAVKSAGGEAGYVMPEMMPAPTAMPYTESYARESASSGSLPVDQNRLVIQNADLTIVVADPKVKMDAVAALAERMGGFVVNSSLYQNYTNSGMLVPEAYITIRIPAEKLEDALKEIKDGVVEVQNENRTGQDVTQEYTDLKSRLRNLEAAESQLQEIMDKAEKTEDVINVFNQLVYYREQIEVVKGQMQYYEQSAALSAISIRIVAEETIKPIEVAGWKPQGVARDAIQDLIYFFQDFVDFLIWFALNFLPKLIVIGVVFILPLWLIVRSIRRWLAKRKAAKAPPAQ